MLFPFAKYEIFHLKFWLGFISLGIYFLCALMVSSEDYADDFIQIQTIYFPALVFEMLHQPASLHNPISQNVRFAFNLSTDSRSKPIRERNFKRK
jgi:hypothetical protein